MQSYIKVNGFCFHADTQLLKHCFRKDISITHLKLRDLIFFNNNLVDHICVYFCIQLFSIYVCFLPIQCLLIHIYVYIYFIKSYHFYELFSIFKIAWLFFISILLYLFKSYFVDFCKSILSSVPWLHWNQKSTWGK